MKCLNHHARVLTQMPKLEKDFETEWFDGEVPLSTRHDDPYYSRSDGLAETRHVFIRGNDLQQRLSRARETVVGELGFGTGLNFLAACASEWLSLARSP